MTPQPAVEVQDVTVHYGDVLALDRVSLSCRQDGCAGWSG